MDFAFGFDVDDNDGTGAPKEEQNIEKLPVKPVTQVLWCDELCPDMVPCDALQFSTPIGHTTLFRKTHDSIVHDIDQLKRQNSGAAVALDKETDLIPGLYEGGLKTWEGGIDLTQFLLTHFSPADVQGIRVLEIGCGSGMPGIALLRLGAFVDFLDYNEEVLKYVTMPNVVLNQPDGPSLSDRCRFFAGDWAGLNEALQTSLPNKKYDVILTSETIYSLETQPTLYSAIKGSLSHTASASAYVAAKSVYFGVGGSVHSFSQLVQADGAMRLAVCAQFTDGPTREILRLAWPESDC